MDAPALAERHVPISATRWIVRTFLGWTVGFVLAIACVIAVDSVGLRGTQSPLAIGMGLGVGLMQGRLLALLLAPPPIGARAWVAATTLGLSLPFVATDVVTLLGGSIPYALSAYVAIGGVLAGALQWRLLRRAVASAAWWPILTPIGWLLAASMVWVSEALPRDVRGLAGAGRYVAVILAGGLILGAFGALAWRLMRSRPHGVNGVPRSAVPDAQVTPP
jgi:hypothetical protein